MSAAYHLIDVAVEERPLYGRGRPSSHKPRAVQAMRYRLKTSIRAHTERMARMEEEAGCFVLLTNVPTTGDLAHSAGDILKVYKDQHGTEQNYGFLKDPVIVNSLFLKKPERIEALGLVLLLALLIWRLMERAMRTYVDTTSTPLTGWDKKATERPTSFMMVTKFAGVLVLKLGHHRQLARPLSVVQQQYLTALDVSPACFTDCKSG
jgi:transposase